MTTLREQSHNRSEASAGQSLFRLSVMTQDDVPDVGRVERRCFSNPWPASAYRRELHSPAQNYYVVLRAMPRLDTAGKHDGPTWSLGDEQDGGDRPIPRRSLLSIGRGRRAIGNGNGHAPMVGFAGMWFAFDEAHVTTICVDAEYRGRGLGELLFLCMIDEAISRGTNWLTLEVRVSNEAAQTLYRKYGFTVHGTRKRYYSDNNEDALIMWSGSLLDPVVLAAFDARRVALATRLRDALENNSLSPFSRPASRASR